MISAMACFVSLLPATCWSCSEQKRAEIMDFPTAELQEGDLALTVLGVDDNKFKVEADQAANYTLTVDLKNMKLNVKENDGTSTVVEEIEVADWIQNAYGIVCEKAHAMALYDISGRKIASVNGTLLPFDGVNSGVYILSIETPQGRSTSKIVIR